MADAIVSLVLKQLVTILYEQAEQEVKLVVGVSREIQTLTSNFQAIQAVLEDAERREVKEATVKHWLNKLKEASYDLEDVLDQWRTALLRLKIKQQIIRKKNRNKVHSFLSSPCFSIKRLASRRDIAIRIKELKEKLDSITREKDRFSFVITVDTSNKERRMTTSFINVTEVHGRKEEKTIVKDMLLSTVKRGSSSSSQHQVEEVLRVVSIVGMGGIGKTTLAQSIYNDDQVKDHFELKIWICVSDVFDEKRIAREILEKCSGESPKVNAMDIILEQVREHISKKRFLLVLDDVWTEEVGIWDELMNTLKSCAVPGSRILVTTRKDKVAGLLGSRPNVDVFPLGVLMKEDSWSLFSQIAFRDKTKHEKEMLEGVGRKIIDKCEGLPLAIKIIASHLWFKRSVEEWHGVLMSDTWKIKDVKKDLFGPLLLSYHELPSATRRCFMYFAVFPKDYEFKKEELIRLWMAQGYCGDANEAKDCFNDLAMRCFFQDLRRISYREYFKMHDIVHDFAMLLCEGQASSVEFTKIQSLIDEDLQKSTRHLSLNIGHASSFHFPPSIYGYNNLRSIHIECTNYSEFDDYSEVDLSTLIWGQFMLVRTLKLKNLQFEVLPDEIRKLELLRYLDLSDNSELSVLPEAICDLCNLQTLDITRCSSLSKLPERIGELTSLVYLRNSETDELKSIPKEIGRLSNLKEVHDFVINSGEKDANLTDLVNFPNIEYISISGWENIGDVNEVKKEIFEGNTRLRVFKLEFDTKGGRNFENEKQEQVLQALIPPSCVEEIRIHKFRGRPLVPTWMASLNNLKCIVLESCIYWEQLPALGELPKLEELYIAYMQRVKKVGAEFLGTGTFPNLKTLEFFYMRDWEEWEWSEEEHPDEAIMPHLMELRIDYCSKLRAIPSQLLGKATLQKLIIHDSRILENLYRHGTGADWPLVAHIPQVEILRL